MGENRASGENTLGGFDVLGACCLQDDYLPIKQDTVCLQSFYVVKLKCVHSKLCGYDECKSNPILEEDLTVKSMNGEKNYGF
jgi:hypothetical protein